MQTILKDNYGRQYVQHVTKYDDKGNIISIGGKFYLPITNHFNYTIKN